MMIDCFSGSLGDLKKGQRTILNALRVLADDPRVSCFERGPSWIECLLLDLTSQGLATERAGYAYPWCRFDLTDKGRQMLADSKRPNVANEGPAR